MAPIDNLVLPLRFIAQVGGSQMLDSVQGALSQCRFTVGLFHTDIKSRDDFSVHFILARYVNTAQQTDVIDGKAGYFLHKL